MASITYVEHNGTAHTVEVATGVSLMEGALGNGVPGIDGDCGGNAACATCHVYVAPGWDSRTGSRSANEEAMLDLADGLQDNSRLACQIFASDDLDGLVVTMPATQH
jgi:ferredoxin, 2Fe-2S